MLFAQHFLQNAAGLLDLLNGSKTEERFFSPSSSASANIANEKECSLLYNIVDTLSNVFHNDVQKTIIAKDGFNLLMQPLVDQVSPVNLPLFARESQKLRFLFFLDRQ